MNLKSLHEIFENRVLRIPDYQRGFAWREQHVIEEFWEDLVHLGSGRVHYTGVITLEPVQTEFLNKWEDDIWLKKIGYRPFYVVDGQQRLTTSIILIQVILDTAREGNNKSLNYQPLDDIGKRYIFIKDADGQRKSYLFGYEKDDPSNEFLKTKIFGEHSHSNLDQQTLYTRNLENAKVSFKNKLTGMGKDDIEQIFEKLTQKLKFNLYEIDDDDEINVFVTFETMNNRGKTLTNLEKLKNRLIYLSTLFEGHSDALRKNINDAWKTIYEYLGKNPETPLSDNQFLRDHWIMYFTYSRRKANEYISFLLKEKFTAQNVTHPNSEDKRLTIDDIIQYVTNLQQSIKPWYYIHNPQLQSDLGDETTRMRLDRLNRLTFGAFRPLILATFVKEKSIDGINSLLEAAERYNFVIFEVSQRRANTGDSTFFRSAHKLFESKHNDVIPKIVNNINKLNDYNFNRKIFSQYISEKFEKQEGFYDWNGLRYFLYEYEQYLFSVSGHNT